MNFRTRTAALIAGLLAVSLFVTGCSGSGGSPSNGTLTVAQIEQAVQDDLSKFTKAHGDKPIQVTGSLLSADATGFILPQVDPSQIPYSYGPQEAVAASEFYSQDSLEPDASVAFQYTFGQDSMTGMMEPIRNDDPFDTSQIQGKDLSFLGDVTYHLWLNNGAVSDISGVRTSDMVQVF